MRRAQRLILAGLAVVLGGLPVSALANPYDISLRGLGRPLDPNSADDMANRRFRFLGNELTMALAPRPFAPAETLGLDGFEVSVGSTVTPISSQSGYWRGQAGSPVFEGVALGGGMPQVFWTPTAHIRKGLPMSMEIGITGPYLAWSEMFMLGAEYKLCIQESFWRWAPALAGRLAFSRLFGNSELSIIAGEADLLASLPIGLGGMIQITPYLGYGQLFAHIDSMVIDETPYEVVSQDDQKGGANGSLYRFKTVEWQNNAHGRLVVGARLIVAFVEVLFEFNYMFMDGPNNLMSYSAKIGFDV